MMNVRDTILTQIRLVARQQHKQLKPLSDDLALTDSGLDSFCIAVLIANLEDELDLDPLGPQHRFTMPKTLGLLITLYERAAAA